MPDSRTRTVEIAHPNSSTDGPPWSRRNFPPCILCIFGGAGDLSHRKLLPALYNLLVDQLLPKKLAIVAFSMEDLDTEKYRAFARDGIEKFSRQKVDDENWSRFSPMLRFVRGTFDTSADYTKLRQRLEEIDNEVGAADNRVFYFAIPPDFIETCASHLNSAGMISKNERPFTRVVVEKPIGHDYASAHDINDRLAKHFAEDQVFRIDHYLGKETVENLMVLRFANAIFEPLWNAKFIDNVQLTVAESEGVGTRAGYYEHAGALRDMVQSHLLQVLSLLAMEPPRTTAANSVRDSKLDVLRTLRPFTPEDVDKWVVRGQYTEGLINGQPVKGYRQEEHVAPDSNMESFVALRCFIENWRWAGVPFYLRTGKRLPKRASEIAIQFNSVPRILFNSGPRTPLAPNLFTIRIQPDEGLSLHIVSKMPGADLRLAPVKVDFHNQSVFPEAYETLLRDVILGDQTLFMRRDSVEAAWQFIQPILDVWGETTVEPPMYAAGSWGPLESALMIAADKRSWRTL
jgi:glucose-6-phosphate 1-dehydrogenase